MRFTIPFITLLSLLPVLVSGQDDPLACRNCKVDVDDADPRIVYSPAASWTHQTNTPKVQGDQIYYMATNSFARAQGASATFKFTGVVCPLFSAYPSHMVPSLGHRILGCSAIVWSYNSDRWGNPDFGNWPKLFDNHSCLACIQYVRRTYNHYSSCNLRYCSFVEYQSRQVPVSTTLRHGCGFYSHGTRVVELTMGACLRRHHRPRSLPVSAPLPLPRQSPPLPALILPRPGWPLWDPYCLCSSSVLYNQCCGWYGWSINNSPFRFQRNLYE